LLIAKAQIDFFINKDYPVFAQWETGDAPEKYTIVRLYRVEVVERDSEIHLLGFDSAGTEYCVGGAVITSEPKDIKTLIWNAGK
jgi:hypothetical protein